MRAGSALAPALCLAAVLASPVVAAEPVFEDEKLARTFARRLGVFADGTAALAAEAAEEQLKATAGKTVTLPLAATPCALVPEKSLYESVVPAVVVVGSVFKCDKCKDWHLGQTASGWLASTDGIVVTNHHVLERAAGNHYGAMTSDGEVYPVKAVLAADAGGDAAVVRIETRGRKLPFLSLGEPPHCGTQVTVISHPKGRFYSLTTGVVSRYHRTRYTDHPDRSRFKADDRPATWMTITADFAVGSSGGPVFNAAGRVVGMASRTSIGRSASEPRKSSATLESGTTPPAARPPDGGGDQMVFKECVSIDTLRGIMGSQGPP